MNSQLPHPLPRRGHALWRIWAIIGITLAILLSLGGLVAIAVIVISHMVVFSWGSNK